MPTRGLQDGYLCCLTIVSSAAIDLLEEGEPHAGDLYARIGEFRSRPWTAFSHLPKVTLSVVFTGR